ncbi:protein kinase domain protein [Ichthyophthirius multifiliis]|uniref:Protein kinase domain protein n=1 Tax=Ichthyophthirius multifiliis TaxID=5932 RepID=G0QJA4_ICHMU|nr:protein kinase domain protein [Ichthyophthirius multifiliis]EGR34713.1 protein kinase domain protein [Ichthyophthirius multifiliis]|eukprot:XP_004040017.1 protein kinase domain protein [Ichthyophthirius multifiliis]
MFLNLVIVIKIFIINILFKKELKCGHIQVQFHFLLQKFLMNAPMMKLLIYGVLVQFYIQCFLEKNHFMANIYKKQLIKFVHANMIFRLIHGIIFRMKQKILSRNAQIKILNLELDQNKFQNIFGFQINIIKQKCYLCNY